MKYQHNYLKAFGFLALIAAAGCTSSSTNPPASGGSGLLAAGSTFTYHITRYNTDGTISQQTDQTATLRTIDDTLQGQQNVYVFDYSNTNGSNYYGSDYYVYGSNGDITSLLPSIQDVVGPEKWVREPFGGAQGVTVIFSNDAPLDYDAMTSTYTGSGTDTVAGVPVAIQKVRLRDSTFRQVGTTQNSYTMTIDYDYAPSIKQMTRIDRSKWTNSVTNAQSGRTVWVLTSYSLK